MAGSDALPGTVSAGAHNGRALAAGDFDGTGCDDLAFGAPFLDVAAVGDDVGDVKVLYGALFADGFGIGSASRWSSGAP